jgi:TPR repeat protein
MMLALPRGLHAEADTLSAAVRTLQQQAAQGNAVAQNDLGIAYDTGEGVAKDQAEAVKWFTKAAQQGNAIARYNLATKYESGQGVAKDTKEAFRWYRLAAAQGYGRGQYNVAVAYANGRDVPRDDVMAAVYFDLAASTLPPEDAAKAAANRERILRGLTEGQRAQVQTVSRQCRETQYRQCGAPPGAAPALAPVASGSAFFINGDGYLVTVAHVVGTCKAVRAPKVGDLQRVAVDSDTDLAVLKASKPSPHYARLHGGRPVRPAESVLTVGFPYPGALRLGPTVTAGVVAALSGLYDDKRFLQITAPVQHGNSGGPLVGSTGAVVGVVDAGLMSDEMTKMSGDLPQSINFAVGLESLRDFLDAKRVRYETAPGAPVRPAPDIAEEAMAYTVLVECLQ